MIIADVMNRKQENDNLQLNRRKIKRLQAVPTRYLVDLHRPISPVWPGGFLSFNSFVGASRQRGRDSKAERLCRH
jgi:hypothetical protein